MDDDKKHTDAAKDYGIIAVLVKNKGTEHIHKAFNFLYDFNEKHEIYAELEEPAAEPLLSDEESTYLSPEAIKAIPFVNQFQERIIQMANIHHGEEGRCRRSVKVQFLMMDKSPDVIYS
jgi:hypothetical protein